jgi:ABC-2 type transport system permease protein
MYELSHIVYYKLKSSLKITVDFSLMGIIKIVGSGFLYLIFAVGAYYLTRLTITYLLQEAHIGFFLLHRFIAMALFVFLITVSVGNIIVAYTTLYRSAEVSYLFTKPVGFTAVFVIKFLDNFFYSSATLFFIGIAVIAGYGSIFHMSAAFYFVVIFLIFLPLMLIAASIAGIILLGLMKLSSVVGPLTVVVSLVSAYLVSIFIYFKFTNPASLVHKVMQFYPQTDQYFAQFDPKISKYLPSHWVGEFLYWTNKGNILESSSYLLQLLITTILLFVFLVIIAKKYYRKSWLLSLEMKFFENRQINDKKILFQRKSIFESQIEVIFKKEVLQFFRDPVQFFHFCVMIIFMAIFTLSIIHIKLGKVSPFMYSTFYTVVYMFTAFLLASLAVRFVYPAISIEARSYWKIKSAPISLRKFFNIKYLIYLIPAIVLGTVLVLFSNWEHRQAYILMVYVTINVVFLSVTLITLNIATGCLFSNFNEHNPVKVASTQGASLTFLLSLVYLVFTSLLMFKVFDFYFFYKNLNVYLVGNLLTVSVFVSLIIISIAYSIGLKSLRRDLLGLL